MTTKPAPSQTRPLRRLGAVLLLACAAVLVALDRPLIRGDGVAYLAWVDSFVLDGDIDLTNQVERLRPVLTYQLTWNEETGRWVNIFPFGAALLQAPFYALGHWFAVNGWWDANPDYFHQMQGVWRPYSMWLMIGANVAALATVWLAWGFGRILTTPAAAALVAGTLFVGTPLIFYSSVSPLNSHNPGALATALFTACLLAVAGLGAAPARLPTLWPYAGLGAAAGLMVLVRWQLLLVAAPAWLIFLLPTVRRETWRGPLLATAVAALTVAPLPLVWQALFGQPFVIPYEEVADGAFLTWPRYSADVLRLLLWHSPGVLLSLIGIPFLWRLDRRWGAYALVAIGLQVWLNGGVLDWWAGETYGMRRLSELYPLYVLLASAVIGHPAAAPALRRRLALAFLVGVIGYTLIYLPVFINYTWTNPLGEFINDPLVMWRHVTAQAQPWQTTWAVYRAHLGPPAWLLPGP